METIILFSFLKAFEMFMKTSVNQCNFWHVTTKYSGTGLHYFFCNEPALHCMSSTVHASLRHFDFSVRLWPRHSSTTILPAVLNSDTVLQILFFEEAGWATRSLPTSQSLDVRNILHQQHKSDFLQMFLSTSQLSFHSHRYLHAVFSFVRQSH
jgi:hypothetical protein